MKVNWYDERRDPDRNPDTGAQGWVTDNVGAGVWDFGNPSIAFSSNGLPAVSYYDGDWGLSVSTYDPTITNWVVSKLQLAGARLGGGNSSILFSPTTDKPVVANVGYVIGGSGPVTLSFLTTNGWITIDSGMLGLDDGGFASLAFDGEQRPTVVFVSGAIVLRWTVHNYLDPAQRESRFETVLMKQGIVQPFQAVQGPLTCVAVSGSTSLSSCLAMEMPRLCINRLDGHHSRVSWTSAGADYDLLSYAEVPFSSPAQTIRIDHSLSEYVAETGSNAAGFFQMTWPPH
ncbi:MAG TPA: hypothetical protein PKI20_17700 [Verrucomicrobiota bacterium]|nr:hypothetical protein [Verrucomicrobiota bacterium]